MIRFPLTVRQALTLDFVATGATALLALTASGFTAGLTDLPEPLLRGAGLVLLPFLALVAAMAFKPKRGGVIAVIAINIAWVIASIVTLAFFVSPNALGYAFVAAQALAVGVFAELQILALRGEAKADGVYA
ncbi:hypothetical protein OK349_05985 [Sphingomonas sp. BT-65]|uniref:hypothetical protein n=1 Tax=Sphingomonas sp. BT-65 TaxID=2989821 RepID=UPI00223609A1|nr:hypothetical protein [Sphingomonas sp. BT-65]MCW4461249.1 hypothetical protein [Sphingomonas sp. BT-65]